MTSDVDICNRALALAQTRANIASLSEDSEEAQNCNLVFVPTRDRVLGMAHWNFNRKTANLNLIKAAPGTAEYPVTSYSQWIPSFPAPPWMYEYQYPSDCVQFRYITPQFSPGGVSGVPIFSVNGYTYDPGFVGPAQKFVVATDVVGPVKTITGITQANPAVITSAAHGFTNGDIVYLTGIIGMTQLNGRLFTVAGATTNTFQLSAEDSTAYSTYLLGGVAVNQTQTGTQQNVILTNSGYAIGTYSALITNYDLWSADALQAFITALAGFIAMPLTKDKDLVAMMFQMANEQIRDARANDGNESLTIQETMPDWMRVRGVEDFSWGGNYFVAPYPPLFSVS